MSDQEKKSAESAIASSVVMVEQTTDSRHKHPYRPTELHDKNEMYQKHSKAPVVPSVAEELKILTEDSTNDNVEIRERKECERAAMSSEKHKHAVGKKLSSSTKRREPSPESIALAPIEKDKKRGSIIPPQPTPPNVDTAVSGAPGLPAEKVAARNPDEDSITDEIAELRTPETEKKHSDWKTPQKAKKEISWVDKEYQDHVVLQEMIERNEAWMLDRKASIGPCFRPGMPFEGPSGIMICLPKKSLNPINQPSGICINISKKSIRSKTKMAENSFDTKKMKDDEKCNKEDCENSFQKFFSNMKDKLANIQSKVKRVFQK